MHGVRTICFHTMTVTNRDGQLELFDLSGHPATKPRQPSLGRFMLQIRQDQLVVAGIAGLVGLTIVFALGVERGKQLVRAERVLLAREEPLPVSEPAADKPAAKIVKPATAAPTVSVKPSAPSKLAASTKPATLVSQASRYAIQVVSYRQLQLAKRELDRLQAKGERAFLVTRNGLTVLCVGPFPTKDHAKEKLVQLQSRYQGCFLKII